MKMFQQSYLFEVLSFTYRMTFKYLDTFIVGFLIIPKLMSCHERNRAIKEMGCK